MEVLLTITLSILVLAWFFLTIKTARNEGYSKGYIDGYKAQQQHQINFLLNGQKGKLEMNNKNGDKSNTTKESR